MRVLAMSLLAVSLLLVGSAAGAVPSTVSFQARLTNDLGQPLDTTVSITFRVYAASSGGAALWTETHSNVVITDGLAEVLLGEFSPLGRTLLDGTTRWLSVAVGAAPESVTRIPVTSTAYAIRANYADTSDRAKYADTAAFALGVGSTGWVDDGTSVRLATTTDQVGIGTSTPMDKLHLSNSASMGASRLLIQTSHATNWAEAGLRIQTPQNLWHLRMDDYTNNDSPDGALSLRSQDLGSEVMTWTSDGKVGIGTTTPTYLLDARSSGVAVYGRTTGGWGVSGVYGRSETTGWGVSGTSTDGVGVYGASTNGYGGYFLGPTSYVSGNLGVGVENPTRKLEVNGELAIQSGGVPKYHFSYHNSGLDLIETGTAYYRLMLKDGGNVGIGTGSPTAKLHVAGDTKVDGVITAGGMLSTSITDEPGVASNRGVQWVDVISTGGLLDFRDIRSRSITVPGPGYVLAIGVVSADMHHTLGDDDCLYVGLSDSTSSCTNRTYQKFCLFGSEGSDRFDIPMTVCNIYQVEEAGPHVYYLVAARSGPADCDIDNPQLYLIYVPTAYGTVSASTYVAAAEVPQPPVETLPSSRESTVQTAAAPSMEEVMKELAALRQEVASLKQERQ